MTTQRIPTSVKVYFQANVIARSKKTSTTVLTALALTSAGTLSALTPSSSFAETIAMPNNTATSYTPRPQRGISKADVESRFGAPLSKNGPRGNPAIYYWEYSDYTVYFENNIVIHAVSKEKSLKPQY